MLMTKPIVVIARPRSGSTLLAGYLAQMPRVAALGEIFKPLKPHPLPALLPEGVLADLRRLQTQDRPAFWRALKAACLGIGCVPSAKMFYSNAAPGDPLWDGFTDGYVLHLIRENLLAAVVSTKLAQRSRIWKGHGGGAYDAEPVTVSPAECEDYLKSLRSRVLWTRARFAGPFYREIRYETIRDPSPTSDAFERFFGVTVALEQRLEQQRRRPLAEVVTNYADVAAFDCDVPLADPGHMI